MRAGVDEVDGRLAGMLSDTQLRGLHAGLVALTTIREDMEAETRGGGAR